eukprot:GILI01028185.1.p1 GENE.GILI01028185.1~~GILI01028185.1.p1  ORF type:complete len:179 (+),score=22.69 GILI01028185.1:169-705(+)
MERNAARVFWESIYYNLDNLPPNRLIAPLLGAGIECKSTDKGNIMKDARGAFIPPGATPLMLAVYGECSEVVSALLKEGASVNGKHEAEDIEPHVGAFVENELRSVNAHNRKLRVVKDSVGMGALHIAAAFDYPLMVSVLLDCGADLDAIVAQGRRPLEIASRDIKSKSFKLLLLEEA